jgi:DNA-binding CsgD family transcriptional regulator
MISASGPGKMQKETRIFIIGPLSCSNEALGAVLNNKLAIEATNLIDVEKITVEKGIEEYKQLLVLFDGSHAEYEAGLSYMQSNPLFSKMQMVFCLFNLSVNSGVERRAFSKGIRGFFYKHDSLKHLLKGIDALLLGEIWVSRDILTELALQGSARENYSVRERTTLTDREIQILALVSVGASNEEIADKLFVSPHTVKTHLYNIFKKIKVPNRFQAALWAAKNI